jgi:hypothetical protein
MVRLIAILSASYLLSHAFDSLLRWLLAQAGAAAAIYLREGAIVFAVLLGTVDLIVKRRPAVVLSAVVAFLIVSSTMSVINGLSPMQVLYGVKVWLPLLLGYLLTSSTATSALHKPALWSGIWLLLVAGVIINYFVKYPWSGMVMTVGDIEITANREWDTGGISRLSGFSRTSYDAAIFVLFLAFYLCVVLRSVFVRIVIWLVSGAVIALTTTKGAITTYIIATPGLPFVLASRPGQGESSSVVRTLSILQIAVPAAAGLLAPVILSQIQFFDLSPNSVEFLLFASFLDRVLNTWPDAFRLLESWQHFTGRGLGGIGVAQGYFEPKLFNPADNMFVYFYVTAGIFGAISYVALAATVWRLDLSTIGGRLCFCTLLIAFVYGVTTNVIESAPSLIAIGAVVAYVLQTPRRRTRRVEVFSRYHQRDVAPPPAVWIR